MKNIYELLGQLTEQQLNEWHNCKKLLFEAELLELEAHARENLLWTEIRRNLKYENYKNEYLIENGFVYGLNFESEYIKNTKPTEDI